MAQKLEWLQRVSHLEPREKLLLACNICSQDQGLQLPFNAIPKHKQRTFHLFLQRL